MDFAHWRLKERSRCRWQWNPQATHRSPRTSHGMSSPRHQCNMGTGSVTCDREGPSPPIAALSRFGCSTAGSACGSAVAGSRRGALGSSLADGRPTRAAALKMRLVAPGMGRFRASPTFRITGMSIASGAPLAGGGGGPRRGKPPRPAGYLARQPRINASEECPYRHGASWSVALMPGSCKASPDSPIGGDTRE